MESRELLSQGWCASLQTFGNKLALSQVWLWVTLSLPRSTVLTEENPGKRETGIHFLFLSHDSGV